MKIGIATCADKRNLTEGDRAFASALESLGARVKPLIWNEQRSRNPDCDAVVIRSTWDYYRQAGAFADWIHSLGRSPVKLLNSAQTIQWNFDKAYLAELHERGLPVAPSLLLKKETPAAAALEKIRARGWSEIESEGELSLIFFQGEMLELSHSVLKRPSPGEFRVQSDFDGLYALATPPPAARELAESLLQEIPGKWAFARVDLVDWQRRPLLGEIEVIEPDLYLSLAPGSGARLAKAVLQKLRS